MAVAEWTGALVDWRAELEALKGWIAPALRRAETRGAAGAFIDGLLGPAERKTGWMLAEQAGMDRPYRIQLSSDIRNWPGGDTRTWPTLSYELRLISSGRCELATNGSRPGL